MKLLSARIRGFQSYTDSGDINFTDGINLIVGQNNAGKSALLRALQPVLPDDRHRTPAIWEESLLARPRVQLNIELFGEDFRREMFRINQCFIPVQEGINYQAFALEFLAQSKIDMRVDHYPNQRFTAPFPSHQQFVWDGRGPKFSAILSTNDGELVINHTTGGLDNLPELTHRIWEREMFYFSAERMNIGQSSPNHETRLTPNATNLPAVLFTLSGDRGDLFQKLVRHLREVFSTVGNLSVRPLTNGSIEIRIWPTDAMERVELSFPLLQSGTGVSQVISILTAVMTVDRAVIIVDEINSFLHPAAVKALLRILQTDYAHHQYIISTHAPEVIGFSNPRTIHLVKRADYESSIINLNLEDVDAFKGVAEHLGVSMSDVFAADRIVWVEGPTEELCFPLLYQSATGQSLPRGTIFTSVMATGDFMAKRRDKKMVYEIYQRLSQVAVPLVVSVAFSFDSENLSDAEKDNMRRDSNGAMHFLQRRHIECYLVNSTAIAAFIRGKNIDPIDLSEATVTAKLDELSTSDAFRIAEWSGDISDPAWLARVDAANIIATACAELTDYRVTFNKKDDTLALLQGVLTANPDDLSELTEYVRSLVEAVG